jgi:hypothetical protein
VAHKFNSIGINATAGGVLAPEYLVAISFGQGMIKIYNTNQHYMLYQIGAHAKWIGGMAVRGPLVVTCGEDSTINGWNITEESVSVMLTQKLPNTLLMGVVVMGNMVMSVAYDWDKLFAINLN